MPPLENVQIQAEKKCLEQFGFGLDPPPLDNVQIEADFFFGIASLTDCTGGDAIMITMMTMET